LLRDVGNRNAGGLIAIADRRFAIVGTTPCLDHAVALTGRASRQQSLARAMFAVFGAPMRSRVSSDAKEPRPQTGPEPWFASCQW
jgi:hypothetical protein